MLVLNVCSIFGNCTLAVWGKLLQSQFPRNPFSILKLPSWIPINSGIFALLRLVLPVGSWTFHVSHILPTVPKHLFLVLAMRAPESAIHFNSFGRQALCKLIISPGREISLPNHEEAKTHYPNNNRSQNKLFRKTHELNHFAFKILPLKKYLNNHIYL